MDKSELDFQKVQLLYKECSNNYRYYLDWRYKTITRFGVTLGSCLVIGKHLIDKPISNELWIIVPLSVVAFVSVASFLMDRRYEKLAMEAARIAGVYESNLTEALDKKLINTKGFYHYQTYGRPKLSFSVIVQTFYILCFIGSISGIAIKLTN